MTLTGKLIVALIAALIIGALVMIDTAADEAPVDQQGTVIDIDTDRSKARHKPRSKR